MQELLAPRSVQFFNNDFILIGDRRRYCEDVARITRIPTTCLSGSLYPDRTNSEMASVAQRFSWAAMRETTREEDMAYCLMGLFAVNMPMLYGEGRRAFLRLQEEIIKSSGEMSIFAWRDPLIGGPATFHGLFADSPTAFESCSHVVPKARRQHSLDKAANRRALLSYEMTNVGLHIYLPMESYDKRFDLWQAILHCDERPSEPLNRSRASNTLAIVLTKLGRGQYARVYCDTLFDAKKPDERSHEIYVRQEHLQILDFRYYILLKPMTCSTGYAVVERVSFDTRWDDERHCYCCVENTEAASSLCPLDTVVNLRGYSQRGPLVVAAVLLECKANKKRLAVLVGIEDPRTDNIALGYDCFESDTLSRMSELQTVFQPHRLSTDMRIPWRTPSHSVRVAQRDALSEAHAAILPSSPNIGRMYSIDVCVQRI